MAAVINTNVASINAQRNLTQSQSALQTSLQRLSSGLRINSAKDDAAGLAISERFTTQIRGLNQAVRNANDGISLAQTGEGALAEMTQNLQRIRELAVQSANATNSDSDRQALNLEVQQRLAEIDRIANQTSFNGRKILDGSFGNAAFQVGANVGETINVGLSTSMRTDSIGAVATATSVDLDTVISTGSAAIPGVTASYTSAAITNFDFATDVTPATPATTGNLGAFTAGGAETGGTDPYTYTLTLTDGTNTVNVADTVAASGTGTAATFATALDAAGFTADGATVSGFTIDYGGQLTAADALTNGTLSFSRADGTNFDISEAFSGTGVPTSTVGFDNAGVLGATGSYTTTDGVLEVIDPSPNRSFTINGPGGSAYTVNLTSDVTNINGLVTAIQTQNPIGYANSGVTVSASGNQLVFTATAAETTGNITISGADEFDVGGTFVAGVTAQPLVAGQSVTVADDFNLQIGASGSTLSVANGTYTTAQSLVDAVNTALAGNGLASLDSNNVMTITANDTITVSGATGLTTLGLAAESTASGSLTGGDVLTAANSNTLMQRLDSALTSVSTLRSTFGAIQNRFESTITSLSATAENLTASRSRIQDTDFAAETAALTRGQILQQAGVAMLAQANQLPNTVLSLLR